MNPGKKVFVLFLIGLLGAWGCAQGPGNTRASAERIRILEGKISKLEEDFKASLTVREQLRKKLATVEEDRIQLSQQVEQLQSIVRERDVLKHQVTVRTVERDNVQRQYEQLRKGIKSLLGQVEAANTNATSQPITAAAATLAPRKS